MRRRPSPPGAPRQRGVPWRRHSPRGQAIGGGLCSRRARSHSLRPLLPEKLLELGDELRGGRQIAGFGRLGGWFLGVARLELFDIAGDLGVLPRSEEHTSELQSLRTI